MPRLALAVAVGLLAAGALTACTDESTDSGPSGPSSGSTSTSPSGSPSDSPTGSTEPTTSAPTTTPSGGTATDPARAVESTDLLDWHAQDGSPDDLVTAGGDWTLRVPKPRTTAVLTGPDGTTTIRPPGRYRIGDSFLVADYAVVVAQDSREELPARAYVVTLATGEQRVLDGSSRPPTVNGGTWAVGDGRLVHATTEPGSYCLAEVRLADLAGEVRWCAEPRHGFNGARLTAAGLTLMSFDDSRPSCRTVGEVVDRALEPVADTGCHGWDALALADGAVWTVVPQERRIEAAHAYARNSQGWWDLGRAQSGSLTACGEAAWFVRDPRRSGDPAELLRWDGSALAVVYRSPAGGEAFLTAPRCGGDAVTVTALTESGDEQVTAVLS